MGISTCSISTSANSPTLFAIQYLSCLINMHAIYAGGSTPTPSPRVHRKQFGYGRPVMPGYSFPHKQASPVHHKSASKDSNDSASKETNFRDAIPAMCTALACVCFICNIILPGLGKKRIYHENILSFVNNLYFDYCKIFYCIFSIIDLQNRLQSENNSTNVCL